MKLVLFLLMFAVVLTVPGFADDLRIATVDVSKIFDSWEFSKQSQRKIEKLKGILESQNNDRKAIIDRLKMTHGQMLQKYRMNAATMRVADREKMVQEIRSLGREHDVLEQSRKDFIAEQQRKQTKQESEIAKLILKGINEVTQAYALEKKYDMVIEMGGHTTQNVPSFLHLEGSVNITNDIIARLNESGADKNP